MLDAVNSQCLSNTFHQILEPLLIVNDRSAREPFKTCRSSKAMTPMLINILLAKASYMVSQTSRGQGIIAHLEWEGKKSYGKVFRCIILEQRAGKTLGIIIQSTTVPNQQDGQSVVCQ